MFIRQFLRLYLISWFLVIQVWKHYLLWFALQWIEPDLGWHQLFALFSHKKVMWHNSSTRDIYFNRLSVHQSVRYPGINVQTGIGVAFEHCLCTFCGDFKQKICPNRGFVTPRKAYFITFELFSSPKGRPWIWQKKNPKNSSFVPMPLSPSPHLRPNIDTCITQTVLSTFEVALYSHGSFPWIFYCIFVLIMLEISGSIV